MWIAVVVIVGAAAAILIAEITDAGSNKRQRQIMREGIRKTGTVTAVERRSIAVRGSYRWEVSVTFDYDGSAYALEQKYVSKPQLQKGDQTTVYIYRKDPCKIFFRI